MKKFNFKHFSHPDTIFTAIDDGEQWMIFWVDEYGKGYTSYSYESVTKFIKEGSWETIA